MTEEMLIPPLPWNHLLFGLKLAADATRTYLVGPGGIIWWRQKVQTHLIAHAEDPRGSILSSISNPERVLVSLIS